MKNIKYILIVSFLLISFFGISQEKYIKHVREADTVTMLVGATKTDGVARLALTNGIDTVFISNKSDTINFTGYSIINNLNVGDLTVKELTTDNIVAASATIDLLVADESTMDGMTSNNTNVINYRKKNVTTSQTIELNSYHYVSVTTGSNNIDLSLTPSEVSRVIIEKADAGVGWVQINETINGRSIFYLSKQYDLIELIYDGSEFKIVNLYLE